MYDALGYTIYGLCLIYDTYACCYYFNSFSLSVFAHDPQRWGRAAPNRLSTKRTGGLAAFGQFNFVLFCTASSSSSTAAAAAVGLAFMTPEKPEEEEEEGETTSLVVVFDHSI